MLQKITLKLTFGIALTLVWAGEQPLACKPCGDAKTGHPAQLSESPLKAEDSSWFWVISLHCSVYLRLADYFCPNSWFLFTDYFFFFFFVTGIKLRTLWFQVGTCAAELNSWPKWLRGWQEDLLFFFFCGGGTENRTHNHVLARQVLMLSCYIPSPYRK